MGGMTLRNLDDALLVELNRVAELRGMQAEALAADLLRETLTLRRDRAAEARAILALQEPRPDLDSAKIIRRDRDKL